MDKTTKLSIWFFAGYVLLMGSLISMAIFMDFDQTATQKSETESESVFQSELMKHERKVEENRNEAPKQLLFNVSDEFAITAVTAGAVLDIIIVLLWAKKENQRLEGKESSGKKRWRDTKLFWNIVAMGVVQPKNNRYSINWLNLIGVTIVLHVLLYLLFTKY